MPHVAKTIGHYQCGHHREWSTADQIFTVHQILEKCGEYGKDTYHLLIDFKAAYDSINRRSLYAATEEMNEYTIKLIALIKDTMNNTQCPVKIKNKLSENGVRQGDALACLIFNIAL
jgi:sorting nexin-29